MFKKQLYGIQCWGFDFLLGAQLHTYLYINLKRKYLPVVRSDGELTVRTCLICSTLLIKAYFELCGEKTPQPFWDYDDGDSTIMIMVKKNEAKTYVYNGVFLM